MRAIERQTGVTPQMLIDRPLCPLGCEQLWQIFNELHASRVVIMGPCRLTFAEFDAFERVTGIKLKPWEVDALRRADRVFINDWNSRQPKPQT